MMGACQAGGGPGAGGEALRGRGAAGGRSHEGVSDGRGGGCAAHAPSGGAQGSLMPPLWRVAR